MRRDRDYPYFAPVEGAPPALAASVDRRVRFEEADPLGIVWHGHYASYLEDGRVAFGDRYGLAYLDMRREGFAAPIVRFHADHRAPLRFGDSCTITARLHWSEPVFLNFDYRIVAVDGREIATAYTVQALTAPNGDILLAWPEYLDDFRRRWREGRMP